MKKRCSLLSILCFLLVLTVFTVNVVFSQAMDRDILPPDILPVVILKGSDYEMGYQYGRQAGKYIVKVVESYWSGALLRYSREQVMRALKANQHYIKEYAPECIDIMRGIADGATAAGFNIQYRDVVLINCTLPKPETSTFPEEAEKDTLPPKKCSVCSAWGSTTKDGELIGLDTLDGGEAYYGVLIIAYPESGNNFMTGAQAGSIGSHFLMNNKGLFIGNSGGGGSPRDIDANYGISWFCGLPHMARFSNNAVEARDMITKWQIDIAENFHFVDVEGNAFIVEKTSAIQAVRKPGDFGEKDFLFSTNNYLCEPMKVTKKGDFIKEHGGYGAYAAPRNKVFWDMLNNYQGNVDVEFMKMILRFPGNPPPYPPGGGWDAVICRPSNSWVSVLIPDDGNKGIAHICTGPAGRVIHSSRSASGRTMRTNYLIPEGTHTFFTIKLAENPGAVIRDSRRNTRNDIASAYEKIMGMNYTDTGYNALNRIYNIAVSEYYEGNSFSHKAVLADGNEALEYFSKAATSYTRAQVHAMQVYEAVSPAPTSPTDLNLKPFGGKWAKWETRVGKSK